MGRAKRSPSKLPTPKKSSVTKSSSQRSKVVENLLKETSSGSLSEITQQASNSRLLIEAHSKVFKLIEEIKEVEKDLHYPKPNRKELTWRQFFTWMDFHIKETGSEIVIEDQHLPSMIVNVKKVGEPDNYALVARNVIEKGNQILFVPKSAFMSTETINEDKAFFEFVSHDPIASCMPNVVLVLQLLNEFSKGDLSRWKPYLNILPKTILPVFTLTTDNLYEVMHSTHLNEMLRMIRSIARQYSYFYERLQNSKLPLAKYFTYNFYVWGVSMVCSRQNEVLSTSHYAPPAHALIPIFDMCNHDPNACQAIQTDAFTRIFADKTMAPGEEIKMNYGQRSSGDFYIHNGFVPSKVFGDCLPIYLAVDQNESYIQTKTSLLKQFKIKPQSRFKLEKKNDRLKMDRDLQIFLIIFFLEYDDIQILKKHAGGPVAFIEELLEVVFGEDKVENDPGTFIFERFRTNINNYLAKRCAIFSALLSTLKISDGPESINLKRLIQNEKAIFDSYCETV